MVEQPYESEDILQALLAEHPDLLAGDQTDGEPHRWLLLAREAPVGDAQHDARWSVDHLFVDQDAVPTIVEVKRSSDTRIRREVIGQMLEYAANAVAYWRLEDLRARCEAAAAAEGNDPDDLLVGLIGRDRDPEEFWEQVRTNLAASRLRLVFVADEIPPELRRLVEFLNEQMQTAEVLAVEVKQYVDVAGQHQTLVPRLVGQTERARQAKGRAGGRSPRRQWDEVTVLESIAERHGADAARITRQVLDWCRAHELELRFGTGQKEGSVAPVLKGGVGCPPFRLYARVVEIQFELLATCAPFEQVEQRKALLARLNALPTVQIPDDRLDKRPSFPISVLFDTDAMSRFLGTMDWVFSELRAHVAAS
jgi:hypothetical protein